jgi:hypothetical protein
MLEMLVPESNFEIRRDATVVAIDQTADAVEATVETAATAPRAR